MSYLLELAERVEAATGPDRSYDVAIFQAIGAPAPFQIFNKLVALEFDEAEQCYFAPVGDMRVRYEPPTYTASLDAAMQLVPALNGQAAYPQLERVGVDAWHAHLGYANKAKGATGHAQKPALAICVAALRARATLEASPRGEG